MTLADAFDEICKMDAPLNERLAAYAAKLRELSLASASAYDELIERLKSGAIGAAAPKPGEWMPPFVLPAGGGRLVNLDDLVAKGPVVVSFNRGHWCPFCKIELNALVTSADEFAALGAQVVAIVPDRQEFAEKLSDITRGSALVLTDIDNGYALSLGLVMSLGDGITNAMKLRGQNLADYHGNNAGFVPLPATFVVGRDGRIIASYIDPDFRKRMEIDDILSALRQAH